MPVNKLTAEEINTARRVMAVVNSAWEYLDFTNATRREWAALRNHTDEEATFDGAGIFKRRGNVIWNSQYGGISRMTLPDVETARLMMDLIKETSS